MPIGPGKYDKNCVDAMEAAKSEGVVLIVFNGEQGDGFSVVGSFEVVAKLPDVLRVVANEVEKSFSKV